MQVHTHKKQNRVHLKMLEAQQEAADRPTALQVGHGVRLGSIGRDFTTGSWLETGNVTDMVISGTGYFAVSNGQETTYTRDGSFRWSNTEDGSLALVTSSENPVLSVDGESIYIPPGVDASSIMVERDGSIFYYNNESERVDVGQLMLVQFANQSGLEAIGSNEYRPTEASGEPLLESENEDLSRSLVYTGYLEGSNVNSATEMVNI